MKNKPRRPTKQGARRSKAAALAKALAGKDGRYDARALAAQVGWHQREMREFLNRDAALLPHETTPVDDQARLATLVALIKKLTVFTGGDMNAVRKWLRTPIRAFDGQSPKEKILAGHISAVGDLLDGMQSGFAL